MHWEDGRWWCECGDELNEPSELLHGICRVCEAQSVREPLSAEEIERVRQAYAGEGATLPS